MIFQESIAVSSSLPHSGWHRADIVAAVKKRGSNLSELARTIGLSPKSLQWACVKRHPRANAAIAEFLDVPLHELWPGFYSAQQAEATPKCAPLSKKAS